MTKLYSGEEDNEDEIMSPTTTRSNDSNNQNDSDPDSPTLSKLIKGERETIYRFDEITNEWYADSSIVRDIKKLETQKWIEIKTTYYSDGTVMSKQFKAPRNCLSPRSYNPHKPKREMSEEQKQAAAERLQKMWEAKKNK